MKDKFVKKFMRLGRLVGSDQNPCLSRGIGSIIVDPVRERLVSMGYNGPARGIPHADTEEFLREYVYPQLTREDKHKILLNQTSTLVEFEKKQTKYNDGEEIDYTKWVYDADSFSKVFAGCKVCPRHLVGAASGERLELCGCAHSEANAIINAVECLNGFYMFAYCGVPCHFCATTIVQSGIKKVYCLRKQDEEKSAYAFWRSRWLFSKTNVELVELDEEWINVD